MYFTANGIKNGIKIILYRKDDENVQGREKPNRKATEI